MKSEKSTDDPKLIRQGSSKVSIEDKSQLALLLVQRADVKTDREFADDKLDRRNEIIELINGSQINLQEERDKLKLLFSAIRQNYSVRFPKIYYIETYRLNGWPILDEKLWHKHPLVGKYTNEIIYSRFQKEVLPILQKINPYVRVGVRKFKHFQFLSPDAQSRLDTFIEQAVEVMKKSSDWYDFRKRLYNEHGVPYQTDLFKDTNSI